MAVLNSVFALLGAVPASVTPSVVAPDSMWHLLILKTFAFIADYGWRIVVFTVLLKLVLSPLDFFQRYKMHKNQKITERLKPTMEKIQKQYGHDKQAFSQKQMELNRKEGYSYFSSCLPMIVTLVVFITLWISMQTIAEYMTFKEYTTMYDEYQYVYSQIYEDSEYRLISAEEMEKWTERAETDAEERKQLEAFKANHPNGIYTREDRDALPEAARKEYDDLSGAFNAVAVKIGQDVIYQTYYYGLDESFTQTLMDNAEYKAVLPNDFKLLRDGNSIDKVQASFLWVKNIWAPDVPWGDQAILDWKAFDKGVDDYKNASTNGLSTSQQADVYSETKYNEVMGKLLSDTTQSRTNGYLILPILVVVLSLGSQILSMFQQKRAGQVNAKGGMATSMKVMMVIMPIMMAVFAIQYASIFAIYMVMNSATTLFFNALFSGIIKLMDSRRRNRNYGIASGSTRNVAAASSKQSPIIHFVKGANPNAGARDALTPAADETEKAEIGKADKKDKKSKKVSGGAGTRTVTRGGRPDPNDLMGVDMSKNNKKK
ncbi:MAG: YidC/Oxa1 family membrane protein insertase [Clostridiales bacterium]|nr:YidC/Oxa1 family membrane protein insertase [Clostridiales bacterium]